MSHVAGIPHKGADITSLYLFRSGNMQWSMDTSCSEIFSFLFFEPEACWRYPTMYPFLTIHHSFTRTRLHLCGSDRCISQLSGTRRRTLHSLCSSHKRGTFLPSELWGYLLWPRDRLQTAAKTWRKALGLVAELCGNAAPATWDTTAHWPVKIH